ncbi:DUF4865 family protein [Streptomyces misionensis]|uniref:DUF4865 family protein n=1 Tax=Streptomyces misionensis TaxID=67331 RepID=UPI003409626C
MIDTPPNGSPLNQYAPFCLWADDDGAARFLWHGPEFSGVVGTYGRPVVQTWIGGALRRGPGFDTDPTWTVRTTSRVPADEAPAATPAAAEEAVAALAERPGVHSAAFGIDPRTGELMTFSMHAEQPNPADGELYEIPYLSASSIHLRCAPCGGTDRGLSASARRSVKYYRTGRKVLRHRVVGDLGLGFEALALPDS